MRLRTFALALALLALLLLAVAGPGTRLGVWNLGFGFQLLRWAVYVGVVAIVLTLAALAVRARRGGSLVPLLVALAAAGIAAGLPLSWMQRARSVPGIHDITTDTQDPPAFVAVLPLRASAPNSATYGGDSVAAKQRAGYPDLAPLHLDAAPGAAYARALAAARAMGWEVVGTDSAAGRVEATATTRWFGFKDDVVVRVRPDGAGSRVDVRSESRVGGSDVGTNAARIRAYLARVRGA
jgi:uncharacterized protein (DUF1499 family)